MRVLIVWSVVGSVWLCGCSLIVESRQAQCQTDRDCSKFAPHPFCVGGVCVESGLGPAGCTATPTPGSDADYLNACTASSCVPFDNCARLQWCDQNAELPALLARP